MGRYTHLYVDRFSLVWKNHVPTILYLLFNEDDFFSEHAADDEGCPQLGYRSNVTQSLNAMNRYGYDLAFFAKVYEVFERDLDSYFLSSLKLDLTDKCDVSEQECETEEEAEIRIADHLEEFPSIGLLAQIEDFVKFLSAALETDSRERPSDKPHAVRLEDGREYELEAKSFLLAEKAGDDYLIDFELLQMHILFRAFDYPPWILKLCQLFDWEYVRDYPEILDLFFLRCLLEAVEPSSDVTLDLYDVYEEAEEVKSVHAELAHSLVEKVRLYNTVFQSLIEGEPEIRDKFIESEARQLLAACRADLGPYEKGRKLEQLMEVLFTANDTVDLVQKRVSTGDEEIDLLIKNNIDRPFWISLRSPTFFVECKNWSDRVGAKEARDFEGKVNNHSSICRLGFLVSLNGFTSEVETELKRAGREDYHIVLLDGSDLDEFLEAGRPFLEWLEDRIVQLH